MSSLLSRTVSVRESAEPPISKLDNVLARVKDTGVSLKEGFGSLSARLGNALQSIKRKTALLEDDKEIYLQLGRQVHAPVPRELRTELWMSSLQRNAAGMRAFDAFSTLSAKELSTEAANDIEKDLARTFPNTKRFNTEEGLASLRAVLRAYAAYDPKVEYCQGMNFVAGLLLMFLPSDAHAFGALVVLMEDRGLRKFYSRSMSLLQVQLWQLGKLMTPSLCQHMEMLGVVPMLYAAAWLMTCFSADFPTSFSARIMDVMLADKCDFALLKVAVTILKHCERRLQASNNLEDVLRLLKLELPASEVATLHDILSDAFSKPWTTRQLSVLHSTEGAETVAQAMDRVMSLQAAAAAAEADDDDGDGPPAGAASGGVPADSGASFTGVVGGSLFIPRRSSGDGPYAAPMLRPPPSYSPGCMSPPAAAEGLGSAGAGAGPLGIEGASPYMSPRPSSDLSRRQSGHSGGGQVGGSEGETTVARSTLSASDGTWTPGLSVVSTTAVTEQPSPAVPETVARTGSGATAWDTYMPPAVTPQRLLGGIESAASSAMEALRSLQSHGPPPPPQQQHLSESTTPHQHQLHSSGGSGAFILAQSLGSAGSSGVIPASLLPHQPQQAQPQQQQRTAHVPSLKEDDWGEYADAQNQMRQLSRSVPGSFLRADGSGSGAEQGGDRTAGTTETNVHWSSVGGVSMNSVHPAGLVRPLVASRPGPSPLASRCVSASEAAAAAQSGSGSDGGASEATPPELATVSLGPLPATAAETAAAASASSSVGPIWEQAAAAVISATGMSATSASGSSTSVVAAPGVLSALSLVPNGSADVSAPATPTAASCATPTAQQQQEGGTAPDAQQQQPHHGKTNSATDVGCDILRAMSFLGVASVAASYDAKATLAEAMYADSPSREQVQLSAGGPAEGSLPHRAALSPVKASSSILMVPPPQGMAEPTVSSSPPDTVFAPSFPPMDAASVVHDGAVASELLPGAEDRRPLGAPPGERSGGSAAMPPLPPGVAAGLPAMASSEPGSGFAPSAGTGASAGNMVHHRASEPGATLPMASCQSSSSAASSVWSSGGLRRPALYVDGIPMFDPKPLAQEVQEDRMSDAASVGFRSLGRDLKLASLIGAATGASHSSVLAAAERSMGSEYELAARSSAGGSILSERSSIGGPSLSFLRRPTFCVDGIPMFDPKTVMEDLPGRESELLPSSSMHHHDHHHANHHHHHHHPLHSGGESFSSITSQGAADLAFLSTASALAPGMETSAPVAEAPGGGGSSSSNGSGLGQATQQPQEAGDLIATSSSSLPKSPRHPHSRQRQSPPSPLGSSSSGGDASGAAGAVGPRCQGILASTAAATARAAHHAAAAEHAATTISRSYAAQHHGSTGAIIEAYMGATAGRGVAIPRSSPSSAASSPGPGTPTHISPRHSCDGTTRLGQVAGAAAGKPPQPHSAHLHGSNGGVLPHRAPLAATQLHRTNHHHVPHHHLHHSHSQHHAHHAEQHQPLPEQQAATAPLALASDGSGSSGGSATGTSPLRASSSGAIPQGTASATPHPSAAACNQLLSPDSSRCASSSSHRGSHAGSTAELSPGLLSKGASADLDIAMLQQMEHYDMAVAAGVAQPAAAAAAAVGAGAPPAAAGLPLR